MKLSTTVTAAVGAAAGLAVAVGAYQASSAVGQAPSDTVNTSVLQQPATSPVAQTQLADCESPSHLVGTDCVTDVERIIVMNDASRSREAHEDDSLDAAEDHASAEDDADHEDGAHHEDGAQEPEDD